MGIQRDAGRAIEVETFRGRGENIEEKIYGDRALAMTLVVSSTPITIQSSDATE